jgi:replicative DNA helicase
MAETPQGFVLPKNTEAERSVLGGVLLDAEIAVEVFSRLSADDFSDERNSLVYRACASLDSRNVGIDLVTVTEELQRLKWIDSAGGLEYLATLASDIPILSSVLQHAELVREKSLMRKLFTASQLSIGDVVEGALPPREILDKAEKRIFEIGERMVNRDFTHISELAKQGIADLESLSRAGTHVTGLSTGIDGLDKMTTGLHGGELIIIAARPSAGKTTLALSIASHIADKSPGAVAFFSLEMAERELGKRMLCSDAGIGLKAVIEGSLTPKGWQEYLHAADRLSRLRLYIDDTPGITSMELRAKARHLKKRHGLSAVFVDYLQLMRGMGREENKQQEIAKISGDLKALAKDLDVPVVALSQLSRRAVAHEGPPRLSDLRESGAIEQDADLVIFIHDQHIDISGSDSGSGAPRDVSLVIGKQRNGPRGSLDLLFEISRGRFVEKSQNYQ